MITKYWYTEVIQEDEMEGTNEIVEIPIKNSCNLSSKKQVNYSTKKSLNKKQISSENIITLKFVTLEMNKDSINFHELNEKINSAEDNNQKTNQDVIRCYYNFGKGYSLWYNFYRQSHNEDAFNSLVNDKIREHIPD
ncbi:14394_t:CDS:2 [Cetraspora pellucida]|uniref:14394_t:CDS:1 n=1 Tax=Cetraspora pellucida TaxID=1433469 RepID=A0A9N9P1R1_9GLOM|nr:14394_t:CDS:2 [Cetraspora pellucida]